MKTQKFEDADGPTLGALQTLSGVAQTQSVEPRIAKRLNLVQELFAQDLSWVEAALHEATSEGPEPASSAARHLVTRGGKRVRPLALLLSCACFGPISQKARELAVVAELVHSATLLHDDVIDDGTERRGGPTARVIWSNSISVLAGDLLLTHALERTARAAPELLPDVIATLQRLVEGEIVQLRGRKELDVSEVTYERILRDKTASLFAFATRTGARIAGASLEEQQEMTAFGERLGMAFQLVDDVLDYTGEKSGKNLFADLIEGKLTLPLVLAVQRRPELIAPLKRIHAGERELVSSVSRVVVECGACDEVRRRAGDYTSQAIAGLNKIAKGPARLLLQNVALELSARVL